jgi:hypothetical protein
MSEEPDEFWVLVVLAMALAVALIVLSFLVPH